MENCRVKHTIFFDLGNVLLFFDLHKMRRQIADVCALDLSEVERLVLEQANPYEKGWINTQDIYDCFNSLAKKKFTSSELQKAMCTIFEPNEEVISLAHQLKAKGMRLFILSNTCEAHFEYILKEFSFLELFDGFVLSYKVGARKPEKEIFESALLSAECEKERCFYIDDIPEFVLAAKALDIDAEQYTTPHLLKTHLHERNIL